MHPIKTIIATRYVKNSDLYLTKTFGSDNKYSLNNSTLKRGKSSQPPKPAFRSKQWQRNSRHCNHNNTNTNNNNNKQEAEETPTKKASAERGLAHPLPNMSQLLHALQHTSYLYMVTIVGTPRDTFDEFCISFVLVSTESAFYPDANGRGKRFRYTSTHYNYSKKRDNRTLSDTMCYLRQLQFITYIVFGYFVLVIEDLGVERRHFSAKIFRWIGDVWVGCVIWPFCRYLRFYWYWRN